MGVIFVHTNIIAKDWRKLAQFYIEVFGCEPVYPERDISGEWIDRVTNLKDVHIRGIHLKLPGYMDGPTLEIFQFEQGLETGELPAVNQTGFAHLAFLVEDVEYYFSKLIENGGSKLGELVEQEIGGLGVLTVVYGRDPEGNIVEIQNWK